MKTFRKFIEIAERYYEPNEPLPSGKTPYGKSVSSYYRQKGEYFRKPRSQRTPENAQKITKQIQRVNTHVRRGADNPEFDLRPEKSGRYEITGDSTKNMSVRDRDSGVEMKIRQQDKIYPGKKPVYNIDWYNLNPKGNHNPGEARRVVRSVADMWKNQVSPKLPSNVVITNYPLPNRKKNIRGKFYSNVGGFGDVGDTGRQYASVNRPPSPKQAAKGVKRTTPLPGDVNPRFADRDEMRQAFKDRQKPHRPKLSWARQEGKPRKIAPAKPSRPSFNAALKNLKNTSFTQAPSIPKSSSIKALKPKLRIKGGGKAALAGAAIAGAGALYSALRSKK